MSLHPLLPCLAHTWIEVLDQASHTSPRPTLPPHHFTVQFTSHHMGNYIFLAETPFPQLLVDLLNFCSTSRISFSRIVSKCSVFSILSILKCSVVSGGEIDRFPSNHIINIFHQLNLDRIMLAFEMPACLSPSTHKSRGIQRCISHYEKALKLQNHSRIFVIWDPVVE